MPVASFAYDGTNRRQSVTSGSTTFTTVYDGYTPVQELSGGSVHSNFLTGTGIDERFTQTEGSNTSTYLADLLGSTVALTDNSGTVQTNYAYDPYGVTTSSGTANDNEFQFTGRSNDDFGLYYNRSRYYNPVWGRFISEDPLGLQLGANVYMYVGDDPLNLSDPMGLWPYGMSTTGFTFAGVTMPPKQTVVNNVRQALINGGFCKTNTQALQIGNDLADQIGYSDLPLAAAIQDSLNNGTPLSKSDQRSAQSFINQLPSADRQPLTRLLGGSGK